MTTVDETKQAKRETRQLWEDARAAHAAGDYRRARALARKVAETMPDSDIGREAKLEAQNLGLDRIAIYAGLGCVGVYLLGWLFALS